MCIQTMKIGRKVFVHDDLIDTLMAKWAQVHVFNTSLIWHLQVHYNKHKEVIWLDNYQNTNLKQLPRRLT